jgi:hypothetical protein
VIIKFKKSLALSEFKLFVAPDVVAEDVDAGVEVVDGLTVLMAIPFVKSRLIHSNDYIQLIGADDLRRH